MGRQGSAAALFSGLNAPDTPGIGRSSRANQTPQDSGGLQPVTPVLFEPLCVIFPFTARLRVTQSAEDFKRRIDSFRENAYNIREF